jgi:predicted PurR-regulated permease PerM
VFEITSERRNNLIGYGALSLIIISLPLLHLVSLAVYFLFLFLLTDVFTNDLNRRFPRLPKMFLFWSFFLIGLAAIGFLMFVFLPVIIKDIPLYFSLIREDSLQFIHSLAMRFDIGIDDEAIKDVIFAQSAKSLGIAVKIVNTLSKEVIYVLFAFILNMLLFLEKGVVHRVFFTHDASMTAFLYRFCSARFNRFYRYFRKVMVGQFFISIINTSITSIVILSLGLPHKVTLLCIVFLCGLVPVIGNLISNTILSVTALISSGVPPFIICLALLVGIHKLEYFLNGKIIGTIIQLPMFATVLCLLAGEATLGVFGMIVAIPFALTLRDEFNAMTFNAGEKSCATSHTSS